MCGTHECSQDGAEAELVVVVAGEIVHARVGVLEVEIIVCTCLGVLQHLIRAHDLGTHNHTHPHTNSMHTGTRSSHVERHTEGHTHTQTPQQRTQTQCHKRGGTELSHKQSHSHAVRQVRPATRRAARVPRAASSAHMPRAQAETHRARDRRKGKRTLTNAAFDSGLFLFLSGCSCSQWERWVSQTHMQQ